MSCLPSHYRVGWRALRDNVASPGVGAFDHQHGDVNFKAYYQWVSFVLFLQGCLFHAPHLIFKMWEGGKVSNLYILGLLLLLIQR